MEWTPERRLRIIDTIARQVIMGEATAQGGCEKIMFLARYGDDFLDAKVEQEPSIFPEWYEKTNGE